MDNMDSGRLIEALSSDWQAEMRGYHTYNALSLEESDPQRRRALCSLALARETSRRFVGWAAHRSWAPAPEYEGSESCEADSLANRIGGKELALRRLELEESRDIATKASRFGNWAPTMSW